MGLSAPRMAAASSSVSLPWASIDLRIVSLRSASSRSRPTRSWISRIDHLVQAAGPLLAVARDERDRVALVEQLDDALHLNAPDLEVLRDPAQVDLNRVVHEKVHLRKENGDDGGGGPRLTPPRAREFGRSRRADHPGLRPRRRWPTLEEGPRTVKRANRAEPPGSIRVFAPATAAADALPGPVRGGIW